jgi:PTS system galactitol-specific IIC component
LTAVNYSDSVEILKNALAAFFSFKAYVMLPLVIFVLALLVRLKIGQAALAALKVAVGFAGIFLIFDFFVASIGPAVQSLIARRGLDYPVLDVGWPPLAAITWASKIAPLSIPLVLAINLVMLATNTTRTLGIDVWNYWHYALVGALLQQVTGSFWIGLGATALIAIYSIKMADWSAPLVEEVAALPGISITTLSVNGLYPYGLAADALFEAIPGVRRIRWRPETGRQGALAILNEPMILGVLIGVFLGVLAGYRVRQILELAIHVAAVMFLLPHCGHLIGSGMQPFNLQLKAAIQRVFPHRLGLTVGMDSGVLMGMPSVIVTGLLLMPISLGLAFLVPGNKTIPLGDLANLVSVLSLIVLAMRGNVFRAVLAGIPIVVGYLLIATTLSPLYTRLAGEAGSQTSYAGPITAFTDGGNIVRYWFLHLFQGNWIALALLVPAGALLWFSWRRYRPAGRRPGSTGG